MRDKQTEINDFGSGYGETNFCRVPNRFIDFQLAKMSRSELVVFLYINRRTLGFNKRFDAISYDQFLEGICTKDGRRLDCGTGLSRKSLTTALDTLVKMGAIFRHSRHASNGACISSVFELNLDGKPCYQPASTLLERDSDQPDLDQDAPDNFIELEPDRPIPPHNNSPKTSATYSPPQVSDQTLDETGVCPPGLQPQLAATSTPYSQPKITPPLNTYPGSQNSPTPGLNNSPTPGLNNSPAPGVKSNPTKERSYQNKVNQNKDHINHVSDELAQDLIQAGIWPKQAERLAAITRSNGRGKPYLDSWLTWLREQPTIHNPGAYLAKAIEANSDLPTPPGSQLSNSPLADPTQRYHEQYRQRTNRLIESVRKYGLTP